LTIARICAEPNNSSIECMRLDAYFHFGADGQFNNVRLPLDPKTCLNFSNINLMRSSTFVLA
jgi:hypothetical protein